MADAIETRVTKLELWKNGNGLPGAAEMAQRQEKRLAIIEAHHIEEPHILKEAVLAAMKAQSKSKEGMIRALGPYFATLIVIITTILDKVL